MRPDSPAVSGSDGGDGGSEGGSDGGSTGGENPQVNITLAPSGFQGIVMDSIIDDTNILADAMEANGYTPNVQRSWEGAALFASGGPDFSTIGSFEAARLAVERDLDLAVTAKLAPIFQGLYVDTGGPYDPDNTGSVQASIDKVVEDEAQLGLGSWAGGDVPPHTVALDERYGYDLSEESGDFNVVTADYFAIPTLINDGDLATGITSPIHGAARFPANDQNDVKQLFSASAVLEEGLGVPQLNSWTTTQEYVDNNRGAVEGLVQAWYEGMQWFFDDPVSIVREDDEHIEQLGVENADQAEYIVNWGINMEYDNEYPIVYQDVELTDDFIEQGGNFLDAGAEVGFVPENWEERMSYVKIPQQ